MIKGHQCALPLTTVLTISGGKCNIGVGPSPPGTLKMRQVTGDTRRKYAHYLHVFPFSLPLLPVSFFALPITTFLSKGEGFPPSPLTHSHIKGEVWQKRLSFAALHFRQATLKLQPPPSSSLTREREVTCLSVCHMNESLSLAMAKVGIPDLRSWPTVSPFRGYSMRISSLFPCNSVF